MDKELKGIVESIESSDRWVIVTMNKDGVTTKVSKDLDNPPHIADLINVGLLHSALSEFGDSLYSERVTEEY